MRDGIAQAHRTPPHRGESKGAALTGCALTKMIDPPAGNRRSEDSAGPPVSRICQLRATRGYDMVAGALGSVWFLVLALVVGLKAFSQAESVNVAGFSPTGWFALLANVSLFIFYLALWWLMLLRPSPLTRTEGVLPPVVAFAGSYLPWTIVLFTPDDASLARNLASAALLLIGTALMVVVICHLGRSFSIVPQARRLVREGPYAVVRHPLYLAEEVALLGTLLQFYSVTGLVLVLVHGVLQVRRILYEEDLLSRTFPDYEVYAKSTSRLVPYLW